MTTDPAPIDMQAQAVPLSWTQAWLIALTQPNERSYTTLAEDPSASVRKAFAWLFVSGLIASAIASLLRLALISSALSGLEQSSDTTLGLGVVVLMALLCVVPISAAISGVGLMIFSGIQQFVASALGGQGNFTRLYYVMAAYTAPISVAGSLLALIPWLGACLSALIGIYTLGLNALAIKSVNRFGWGSAIVSMVVPLIFMVLVMVIIFFGLLYPVMSELLTQPAG